MTTPSQPTASITNKHLRVMGWASFLGAVGMAVAGGFDWFQPSDTLVLGFLAHAALSFGMPTVRNIMEGYAPNQRPTGG